MQAYRKFRCPAVVAGLIAVLSPGTQAAYTRLEPVPAPKLLADSIAYPGGNHEAKNVLDGEASTEYSSASLGTNTYLDLGFSEPTMIAAFRHQDRNDPATVAASDLVLFDAAGNATGSFAIPHVNKRAGVTLFLLPKPVTASRALWRVSKLGSPYATVGGAEIQFFKPGPVDVHPTQVRLRLKQQQLLERGEGGVMQPVQFLIQYPYSEPCQARVSVEGAGEKEVALSFGTHAVEFKLPATEKEGLVKARFTAGESSRIDFTATLKPVRRLDIYLLPHSHVDIGYTALQAEVEKKQQSNLETGLRLARTTQSYPEGARFKWNVEVLWPVDNYLRTATPAQRKEFVEAVQSGKIGLDAFYCNVLTGLCRPEELLNLMRYAGELSAMCGVPVDSAMISDVPGYTWSTVTAMAEAGVKYFSFAPNYFDRMGGTMKEWQNRPFWWKGPDGKQRVLCWCPSRGYALGHIIGDGEALARFIPQYLTELETNSYPYAITHLRWNVHGDNGAPDEKVADVVRDWNMRYESPRLIIATTAEAFRAFEKEYGDKLPEYSGDYTPYWEDGAGSSARETAINRDSAERLSQAEALWALRNPAPYPAAEFKEAWRNVLLYSEHTWGAHNSISQPDLPFVKEQWRVKQAFALDAEKQSRELLARALATSGAADLLEVHNTSSWKRTDLAVVPGESSRSGDRVVDARGKAVPSQRLSTGELVFLAVDIPAFSSRRFRVEQGTDSRKGASANGTKLESNDFRIEAHEQTGAIKTLYSRKLGRELVDRAGAGLNEFLYLPGSDLSQVKRNGAPQIRVKEAGPLVASLVIETDAPGCKSLVREVRLVQGLDRVEFINTIDKLPVRTKEGLHFGFGFDVPGGIPRFDVGWAAVRPELDQIPASCKNWFSVQRWVDVSNEDFGVTWAPVDAPLVQLGGLTANLVGSQTDYRVWVQHLEPSSRLYSWAMNNHWHTNYRAEQEGPTVFRYLVRAHKRYTGEDAARFGVDCSQPLLVARASAGKGSNSARLQVSNERVIVAGLKPTDDGQGTLVRLFAPCEKAQRVTLKWPDSAPKRLWLSDTSESRKEPVTRAIEVPAWGLVTLRAE